MGATFNNDYNNGDYGVPIDKGGYLIDIRYLVLLQENNSDQL